MKIIIIQKGEHPGDDRPHNCEVEGYGAIPSAVFGASQHFGEGTYVAVIDGAQGFFADGERVFRMTTEWVES